MVGRHHHSRGIYETHVARNNDTLTAECTNADDALFIHLRNLLLVGYEAGKLRNVAR